MAARRLRIGSWTAEESSDRLISRDTSVKLERRAMATLLLLAEHSGETISRERILAEVWSGLHVSNHSVAIVISDLRRALGDDRQRPRYIETIPKRGYRLIAPVSEADPPRLRPDRRIALASLAAGAAAMTAAGLWAFGPVPGRRETETIYVRDIAGPSEDHSAAYFEYALSDIISATLAQSPSLSVVRLRSGQSVPAGEGLLVSGRTLSEGANRLALIQLGDPASGEVEWARTYAVAPGRLAARGLEIARDVARRIGVDPSGSALAAVPAEAHERYWRARYLWDRRRTDTIRAARQLLEDLVADQPGFAAAHSALAEIYAHKSGEELGIPRLDTFAAARRHLEAARALAPATAELFVTEAVLSFYADRDYAAARAAAQRAIELAPGRPAPWQTLAMVESATGSPAAAVSAIDRARTLDPGSGSVAWDRAWHLHLSGREREALAATEEARRLGQSVSLLSAMIHDAGNRPEASFRAWLERAGDAGVPADRLESLRATRDRANAYRELADDLRAFARPPRPVIVALLLVKAGRNDEALRSLSEARQGRSDWMTAWVPRMREFASIRSLAASSEEKLRPS